MLDALHSAHITVVLQLVGTPSWANGGKGPNYAPTSSAPFGAFATAAAREYPWVKDWLIWNEPNQVIWLRPTSPAIYVTRLLNPAYAAIHKEISGAVVAGGGTAPRGSTGGVSPVAWIAGMHAVHARLDAYAHNPYPLDPKHETPTTGGCETCLTITMATINRLVALVGKDFPSARIWLSEYGYQTNPPDKVLGVSPALQARYLSEAAYVAYHTPRVDMLIQFLYRDEPNVARFQSGLTTITNQIKPSYYAFELPLAETSRRGTTTSLWGQLRAPGAAGPTATLQRQVGTAWRTRRDDPPWRGRLPPLARHAPQRCGRPPARRTGHRRAAHDRVAARRAAISWSRPIRERPSIPASRAWRSSSRFDSASSPSPSGCAVPKSRSASSTTRSSSASPATIPSASRT